MANSQPANADIHVFRTVRAYRQDLRHEAVKALLGFPSMRHLVMSVPGEEVLVDETRDGSSDLVTTSVDDNRRGLPVVVFLKTAKTAVDAVSGISGLAFPIRIGRDLFLEKTLANIEDDLHENLRDA